MEPMAMANLISGLANRLSLSMYPTTMATITKGRRSDFSGQGWNSVSTRLLNTTRRTSEGYWLQTRWCHPLCTCSSTSWRPGSSTAAHRSRGLDAEQRRKNRQVTNAESSHQVHVLQRIRDEVISCLPLWAAGHKDVLRRQEQNNAQGPRIHLGNGDGEDQDPWEDAGQGMDDGQEREPQQQPQVGGEPTLGNRRERKDILFVLQVAMLKD